MHATLQADVQVHARIRFLFHSLGAGMALETGHGVRRSGAGWLLLGKQRMLINNSPTDQCSPLMIILKCCVHDKLG